MLVNNNILMVQGTDCPINPFELCVEMSNLPIDTTDLGLLIRAFKKHQTKVKIWQSNCFQLS